MVTRWGYSDELGLVSYGDNQEEVFLGHSVSRTQNVSEETARKIDSEVRRLVDDGYNEAKRILTERAEDHKRLSHALLEYETLTRRGYRRGAARRKARSPGRYAVADLAADAGSAGDRRRAFAAASGAVGRPGACRRLSAG